MRVLMTGHEGYIGAVMVGVFRSGGHEVVGLEPHTEKIHRAHGEELRVQVCHLGAEPLEVSGQVEHLEQFGRTQ